jgi:hypothetical protein
MAHKRIHESAARFRCANADRCGGGSPSQICAGLRVSARWRASTSISRALISSGETLGATLVKDGRCLVPRGDMAQIRPRRAVYSVVGGGRSGGSYESKNITVIFQLIRYCIGGGSGIRTHVTVSRKHAFQACAFSHSATPPDRTFVNAASLCHRKLATPLPQPPFLIGCQRHTLSGAHLHPPDLILRPFREPASGAQYIRGRSARNRAPARHPDFNYMF